MGHRIILCVLYWAVCMCTGIKYWFQDWEQEKVCSVQIVAC